MKKQKKSSVTEQSVQTQTKRRVGRPKKNVTDNMESQPKRPVGRPKKSEQVQQENIDISPREISTPKFSKLKNKIVNLLDYKNYSIKIEGRRANYSYNIFDEYGDLIEKGSDTNKSDIISRTHDVINSLILKKKGIKPKLQ